MHLVMRTRLTVNGVDYASIDAMPPDVRQQYDRAMAMLADRNNNGVPDIMEGPDAQVTIDGDGTRHVNVTSVSTQTFDVKNWNDLPPHVKQMLQTHAKPDGVSFETHIVRDDARRTWHASVWQLLSFVAFIAVVIYAMWMLRRG